MKLFEPNNLSRRRPEFAPLNDETIVTHVASLLERHYGLALEIAVSTFVGANVSAQNLKIESPARKFFLKSRDQNSFEKMRDEAELTAALDQLGQKVPRIIRARDQELVCLDAARCWVLYEFQEGDYFSGHSNQLKAAAEAFAELTRAAEQLSTSSEEVAVLPADLEALLARARSHPSLANLCTKHQDTIIHNLQQVESEHQLLNGRSRPLHLDFHPLNLLMKDDQVACIVDLEHLKPYPVIAGLGFAAYKLIREAMVDNEFRERELKERAAVQTWLRGWQKCFPEDDFTGDGLGLGARARILRLIHLILDAALNHGDDRFAYDLEKQILSLYEAEVIFS